VLHGVTKNRIMPAFKPASVEFIPHFNPPTTIIRWKKSGKHFSILPQTL
jgi:hypothetical protein